MPTALLVGTLDTKGREYAHMRGLLRDAGADVILMDVGVLGFPATEADITADEVSAAAGVKLSDLQFSREGSDTRAFALETMQRGAVALARRLHEEGRCDGVLGMGGSGGSALISGVMRDLPFGTPKVLVSTMASGDVSSYVGSSDLCIMNSVTDIAGLNRVSRPILANAAGALLGMMAASSHPHHDSSSSPAVGVTMLGVTTPGALRIVERLEAAGYDPVVFHAVGSGGRALERLIEDGVITSVVDFTIKEVTDDVLEGTFVAGPDRLRTAGRMGYPQLVVPGAVEVINFGSIDTVPAHLRDGTRPLVQHNQQVTAVRATRDELARVAEEIADRLNGSIGPTMVVVPTAGFDSYATGDGPFADHDADAAFVELLRTLLRPDIPFRTVDAHINDPRFSDAVAESFLRLMETAKAQPVGDGVEQ